MHTSFTNKCALLTNNVYCELLCLSVQEEVEIKIKIYDLDGGSFNKQAGSDLVAGFWIHPDVRRLPSGVFSEHFSYRNHTSTIVLAYNLTCIQPYHGANCFNPKSSTVSPSFTGESKLLSLVCWGYTYTSPYLCR